jgi:hypothetical protein
MKKLTLTFCALIALVAVAPALYADDGPEKFSGKEKEVMQPAPPVCDFYRAHEWDFSIWGAFAFASDTGQFAFDNSRFQSGIFAGELRNDPFVPDIDPFRIEVSDPTNPCFFRPCASRLQNPNERVNVAQISKNELFARDDTWGGGFDVKYFWSKYFGAGLEGLGLASKTNFAGGGLVTLTGRYPFGRFAPYVTGGIGFIDGGATLYEFFNEQHVYDSNNNVAFLPGTLTPREHEFFTVDPVYNNHLRALGQIGAGLEFRVSCHIGLMADFTWNFVFGQENHPDKERLITEQGAFVITSNGVPISTTQIVNHAFELVPGHGSDHQDFGLARFGVTFSY